MSAAGERLPYPGLRSFTREETDLFFGREGCVDDMVDRLAATRFLAVLGASGSGKSSLVKTGLLDALEIGLLHKAGSRWLIADFRPGDRPIQNLAEGLIRAAAPDPAEQPDEEEARLLRAFLARGPRSVVEWCEADNLPPGANLLLLVDQFEELFRYSAYAEREEAEAFVALLLESARAPLAEARIYVVITMRSEYLGAAALIDGLADAINHGLYLTPRMSRDQVRDAIVGPAAVCGFSIEPALANRLLNDLTSFAPWEDADTGHQLERLVRRADQLPLMQHVLNRLWSIAEARSKGGAIVLKLADYDAVGGLRGALAAHGREILDELLPEHQEVASAVFRALTAGSSLAEAVRRPTEFGELVEIAGGDEIAVREIVEAFRAPGRNFLVPPRPTPLRANTLIDISHESLIRQWDQFAGWLQREITSAETWRRLVDAAERFKRGEANLLSGLALASIANWWDSERPTAAWAKRYGGDFAQSSAFLADSRRAEEAGKQAEIENRRQKSRNRLVTLAIVVVLCIITPLTGFAGYMAWHANREAIRANQEADAADAARQSAEAERQRADQERTKALESQREAVEQAAAAETQRQRADDERQRALAAQQEAVQQAAAAEAERKRADEERQRALAAQQEAQQQAAAAETQRQRADDERQRALAAQQEAVQQAAAAEAARKDAMQQAAAAEAARDSEAQAQQQVIALERQRAEEAFRRSILEQVADRISALQQAGSWGIASNLLGTLWQSVIGPSGDRQESWLIDPIVRAFSRQSMAEYPIFPEFLTYSGYSGWTGTSGRFRVYSLDHKAADGTALPGNKIMAIFDAMSGAVLGSFELPAGQELGSELDLVSPDGSRAAIVTDKAQIAVWAIGQPAPTLVPLPELGGKVAVAQLAPVNSDGRFALYLTVDDKPGELIVIDPATQAVTFTATAAEITAGAGVETLDKVNLLGFVDNRLMLLVNDSSGRVVAVDAVDGRFEVLPTRAGVTGAELTPDGALLLTLTCPGSCAEQHLTAFDVARNAPLWVERVPIGMDLSAPSEMTKVDGQPAYSVLVQHKGAGIVFRIPTDGGKIERVAADTHARIGETSFDGNGSFRTVESAKDVTSDDGLAAAGLLANYRIPLSRQKLSLYVARNSVAIYQGDDAVRIAGVTYDGDLLVYRLRPDGQFEEDVAFRPLPVGKSNCLAAAAFGGDGKSLLLRHIDGSLQYVAAIGNGASIGWKRAASQTDETGVALEDSSPATECDAPADDAPVERIAAADPQGSAFALLDKTGLAAWVNIVDATSGDPAKGGAGAASAGSAPAREFAPLERLADAISWIAGDPMRSRVAIVTRTAVEIVSHGRTIAPEAKDTRAESQSAGPSTEATTTTSAAATPDLPSRQRLSRWNEPKAAAFSPDGDVVATYGAGQISAFHQGDDGAWAVKFDNVVFRSSFQGLYAAKGGIAVADDRNMMLSFDAATGALSGFARLPANPSAVALRADGNAMSLEWDTDSVSTIAFRSITPASSVDAARLVAMRSLLDVEADASLDSLTIEQKMEHSAASASGGSTDGCADALTSTVPRIESRVLGETVSESVAQESTRCAAAEEGQGILAAAESLAERGSGASVMELVDDRAFSRVLQGAASGDATALRMLGAALARISIERGSLEKNAIARDVMRFGTNLPSNVLPPIAAGAPIDPDLVERARAEGGPDPAAHQLVAHWEERQIDDIDALAAALFEFSLAEKLYRAGGRVDEAKFAAHRRAQLARLLPDDRVLAAMSEAEAWKPTAPPATTVAPAASQPALPESAAARRELDMKNAETLAARLPNSPLLDALRTELERARIFDLRNSDPKAAADMLIDFGRRSGETQWSPDLVREYLGLADALRGSEPASAFRLAAESLKMIGAAFRSPIHSDTEASGLFTRAADLAAATVAAAPRDVVATAMNAVDLSLAAYEYDTLPGTKAEAESKEAQQILQSLAHLEEAIAGASDDAQKWNRMRGMSLFWEGVLVNDSDSAKAVPVLQSSTEVLRAAVGADPGNLELRFRFAEALRWVGLAEPSSADTAAIEREGIKEYETVWSDREKLDPNLLNRVGVGYGFGLANLAQTIREYELANLADGRTAEEHVGWVLEVLSLAAKKDDLNAAMIQSGAATGDSGFVAGWYRMSSYGWPIGFLSGLVNIETGGQTVTDCDLLAADPYDPLRRAPGLVLDQVDAAKAETACRTETERSPEDERARYQLARVTSADTKREAEYMPIARASAAAGVSPAFALVAYALSQKDDDKSPDAYIAAAQRTIIESFPVLYPYLLAHAKTDSDRVGLAWYAGKAAALGVAQAHVALADLTKDTQQRLFHLLVATRLFDEAGNPDAAADARRRSDSVLVRTTDEERIKAEVAAWTPEALVELPAEETNPS